MKKKIIEITSAAAKLIDIVKEMQKKNEKKNSKNHTENWLLWTMLLWFADKTLHFIQVTLLNSNKVAIVFCGDAKKIALKKNIANQGRDNYVALFLLFIFRTCINYTWRWLWIYSGGFFLFVKVKTNQVECDMLIWIVLQAKNNFRRADKENAAIFSRYYDRFWHKLFDYVKRAA